MQFILDSVLTPLVMEERKEVILSCVASLEELDYQAALDEIHQVVEMTDTMGDNSMLLSRIDDVIWNAHETIFKQHEIVVDRDASQEVRQAIVTTLSNFDKYIIPDRLVQLFNSEYTDEEIISNMCAAFTTVSEDEAWEAVKSVSTRLMEQIYEVISAKARYYNSDDTEEAPIERIQLLNKCISAVGNNTFGLALQYSRSGVRVGTTDIGSLVQQAMPELDKRIVEHAAIEMLGLLLLSNAVLKEIPNRIRDLIEDFSDNNIDKVNMLNAIKPHLEMIKGYMPDESA